MNTPIPCKECGKELPDNSAHGLCPACLMKLAMNTQSGERPITRTPTLEEIADKFPNYEITECLGRGGMGVVYKARQKSLERWVAIKILAPDRTTDEKFTEHFEREAKTLAKMSHPNIVTVYDHGKTDGIYYIVMEYVDGVNLRDLLQDGKMHPKQALAIVPPICDALEYAHDKGVVHRDIKPENLLLDRDGRVKIADFGIASLIGANMEKSGTPPYMAPEQDRGHADRRADIYSLGVVLYEMLTGERPTKDLIAPSRKVEIDVRLDDIVLQALDSNPSRRYQTAKEFRTRVQTLSPPEPANSPPDPPTQQPSAQQAPPPLPAAHAHAQHAPPAYPATNYSDVNVPRTPRFTRESVKTQFLILAVSWWVGMPLSAISMIEDDDDLMVVGVLSLPPLIVAIVFAYILLYRQWYLLQGYGARTTPAKAVGFSFIPFFCFYWWFVAYAGLAEDTNRYLARAGNHTQRMSYGLAVTVCIISILHCFLSFFILIATISTTIAAIVGFIFMLQQKNCLLAVLDDRLKKQQARP